MPMPTARRGNSNIVSESSNLTRTSTATTTKSGRDMGGMRNRLSLPTKVGRDQSPGLQWHKEYTPETLCQPRCLMIDYIYEGPGVLKKKVVAEEIRDVQTLKNKYIAKSGGREDGTVLRVFHVQNWPRLTHFLIQKFRLHDNGDALTGQSGFVDWVTQKKPQRRAGKPLLMGKTWKVSTDPWRLVSKCAAGLDIMKCYRCGDLHEGNLDKDALVTELTGYDSNDNPIHHSNVFAQRISVYVQNHQPDLQQPGPDMVSPYGAERRPLDQRYDNGNTIIIFDNSQSNSILDTVITARGEWESRWRRLPFYISSRLDLNFRHDEIPGICMRIITQDIFKAIAEVWEDTLDASWEHVSILEDKIYDRPADESRAPELWKNQARWLVYEKLIYGHQDVVNEMSRHLVELDGDLSDEGLWLRESPGDFQRLGTLIEEDLVKRTNNLSELMYKSVGIRDSRESLRLGASMWRLSWITFIFLPLTFLVGFFGMNVRTFSVYPSIKWYFIIAVPFMLVVLFFWYILKHNFTESHPRQRGSYEEFFAQMQSTRPDIWTRQGPRELIQLADTISRWKWALITHWSTAGDATPNHTSQASQLSSARSEDVSAWNRFKCALIRKWTKEIRLIPSDEEFNGGETVGLVTTALKISVEPSLQPAVGMVTLPKEEEVKLDQEELEAAAMMARMEDQAGPRSSGVMVEERTDRPIEDLGNGGETIEPISPPDVAEVDWAARMGRVRTRTGEDHPQQQEEEGDQKKDGKENNARNDANKTL